MRLLRLAAFLLSLALLGCAGEGSRSADYASTATARERPGLATTYGETRGSHVQSRDFQRENEDRPWVLSAIRYNDLEAAAYSGGYYFRQWISLNRLVEFGVRNSEGTFFNIGRKSRFLNSPDYFVIGKSGDRYELVFRNNSDTRLEIVASVDGLDVLDGKSAAVTKRGYLVEPGKTLVVEGWRTSLDTVAAFRFGAVKDSYAEKKIR